MGDIAERFRNVAKRFTDRARAVSDAAWDNASPCEGWVARDIVRHMVAWMPSYFLASNGIEIPAFPSVDVDPFGAWEILRDAIQSALDHSHGSDATLEQGVAAYGIGDILIHTWDLARATGLNEALDANEVHRALRALQRSTQTVLDNGHFAPRVVVPADADEQTKLLALTGRRS